MFQSAVETLTQSLREDWADLIRLTPRLIVAVLLVALMVLLGRIAGRVVVRLLQRGKLTRTHQSFFRHLVGWAFILLGVMIGLNVLGLQAAAAGVLAGGGITAVVLGFALRGIGENLLAGLFLAFSRPFEVGDLIQSGEFQGAVRGIELRNTHIRTDDGRDVFIPSSQIFNQPVVNYTRDGLRRLSFALGVDYGDDTHEARRLLLDAVRAVPEVLADPPPAALVGQPQAQYIELVVSFWVDMFDKRIRIGAVRSDVLERCRRTLQDAGFTLSSEVTTGIVFHNQPPGRQGTDAE